MEEIIQRISELLEKELTPASIELNREVNRGNTVFYVKLNTQDRYIFKITDSCIEDNKGEIILKTIKDSVIPILKENPNKKVVMKSNFSINIQNDEQT